MNYLFLYVDTHYIVAAVRDDNGVVKPIRPKTGDEYFELFFREDTENNRVHYGNSYKNAYFKGEPHCFGQVFRLMAENTKTFSLYDREQPISHLFKEAGILDEWSEAAGYDSAPCAGRQVPTYISFAADVDYASRNIFVENVLKNEGFDVCERSVPVEHLALEHARRSNHLCEDGCYLVLNAYNEQLHFSIYHREGETFVRLDKDTLPGMGTDPRVRALVETVVAKINNVQHFLSIPEEKEKEYCNLEQYADEWLRQLDATRGGCPVHLLGVRFSVAPNTFDVNVTAEEINNRTEKIVRAVINEIKNFVTKILKPDEFLRGILFLGDGFVNEKFSEAVTASYRFQKEDLVYFRRCDLPKIVSVYREINLDQFSTETQMHRKLGEQELIALRNAQAEREREREAARLADEKAQVDAAARKDKEEFFTAMAKIEECERKKDWHSMRDWAQNALQLRPEDKEAKAKLEIATRNIAEDKVRAEQYASSIQQAQDAFEHRDWQEALTHAKTALNVRPDSKTAKKIHDESTKQIDQATRISEFFARAAVFEQQGNYHKALEEFEKVRFLDPNHPELQPRMSTCRLKISERESEILAMKQEYTRAADRHDHEKAAECARRLAAFPESEEQSEWVAREEQHKRAAEAEQKQKEFIDDCTKRYNKAWFDGDWAAFVRYAEEVLRCRKDEELAERVERAKERVRAERDRRQFEEALKRVKVLIADRSYEEARRLLNALKADATTPHQKENVLRLFQRIFDEEDQNNGSSTVKPQQPAGQPQQGKGQSPQPAGQSTKGKQQPKEGADQPPGWNPFFGFFGKREAPKPAPGKKNGGGKAKPAPDDKQKKGAKDETKKGFSLDEFNF